VATEAAVDITAAGSAVDLQVYPRIIASHRLTHIGRQPAGILDIYTVVYPVAGGK
jgi:hypothetical protein